MLVACGLAANSMLLMHESGAPLWRTLANWGLGCTGLEHTAPLTCSFAAALCALRSRAFRLGTQTCMHHRRAMAASLQPPALAESLRAAAWAASKSLVAAVVCNRKV